jgi:hypothetical protein
VALYLKETIDHRGTGMAWSVDDIRKSYNVLDVVNIIEAGLLIWVECIIRTDDARPTKI